MPQILSSGDRHCHPLPQATFGLWHAARGEQGFDKFVVSKSAFQPKLTRMTLTIKLYYSSHIHVVFSMNANFAQFSPKHSYYQTRSGVFLTCLLQRTPNRAGEVSSNVRVPHGIVPSTWNIEEQVPSISTNACSTSGRAWLC
jgi:hypothetical protein